MVLNWVIRKAKEEDFEQILHMEQQFKQDAFERHQFKRYLNMEMFCVAEVDGIVMGYYICFLNHGTLTARIYSICVDKSFHGRGLGKQMMMDLEKKCKDNGMTTIRLEVSVKNSALFLYENMGYEKFDLKENYYTDGDGAFFMRKKLIEDEFSC